LVGPWHVLTASHVVNGDPAGTLYRFRPAYCEAERIGAGFGPASANIVNFVGINTEKASGFDYMICELDRNLGVLVGDDQADPVRPRIFTARSTPSQITSSSESSTSSPRTSRLPSAVMPVGIPTAMTGGVAHVQGGGVERRVGDSMWPSGRVRNSPHGLIETGADPRYLRLLDPRCTPRAATKSSTARVDTTATYASTTTAYGPDRCDGGVQQWTVVRVMADDLLLSADGLATTCRETLSESSGCRTTRRRDVTGTTSRHNPGGRPHPSDPVITVSAMTLEGDVNVVPHPEPSVYTTRFSGDYTHRDHRGGLGHDLPQKAAGRPVEAGIEVDAFDRALSR
jgi:hypothetical protein